MRAAVDTGLSEKIIDESRGVAGAHGTQTLPALGS
jgi:hypothetical protein